MSGKMNWARAGKLYRRMTTDHRFENELPDRADKWLAAVERRQREKRTIAPSRKTKITTGSKSGVPW